VDTIADTSKEHGKLRLAHNPSFGFQLGGRQEADLDTVHIRFFRFQQESDELGLHQYLAVKDPRAGLPEGVEILDRDKLGRACPGPRPPLIN
jgi:hypothetical protein